MTAMNDAPAWVHPRMRVQLDKPFIGLPSDLSLHKARRVPLKCRKGNATAQYRPPLRWISRRKPAAEAAPPRIVYKAPLDGLPVTEEADRHSIVEAFVRSPSLQTSALSSQRFIDVLVGATKAHAQGMPHITKTEHSRNEVIFVQGEQEAPGVFLICEGHVKLSRKNKDVPMDRIQYQLFLTGAIELGFSAEENLLRKPKPSEKEWELSTLGPGSFLGSGGILGDGCHSDTARAHLMAKLVFIPLEILENKLKEAWTLVQQDLELAEQSRQRQFARLVKLFVPAEEPKELANEQDDDPRGLFREHRRRKTDSGMLHVTAPILKAESKTCTEKRYFRRSADVAFAGPYSFKPGEVPLFNPELGVEQRRFQSKYKFLSHQNDMRKRSDAASREVSRCDLPIQRVDRLYQNLWDSCMPSTFRMLMDMQTLEKVPSVATSSPSSPAVPAVPASESLDALGQSRLAEDSPTRSPATPSLSTKAAPVNQGTTHKIVRKSEPMGALQLGDTLQIHLPSLHDMEGLHHEGLMTGHHSGDTTRLPSPNAAVSPARRNSSDGTDEMITSKIPTLDLLKTSLGSPRGPNSARPVTDPGRSRSVREYRCLQTARYDVLNLRDGAPPSPKPPSQQRPATASRPGTGLSAAWQKSRSRPATSEGKRHVSPNFSFPQRLDIYAPSSTRNSNALQRTVAWTGPPDRTHLRPSDYVTRTPLTART